MNSIVCRSSGCIADLVGQTTETACFVPTDGVTGIPRR